MLVFEHLFAVLSLYQLHANTNLRYWTQMLLHCVTFLSHNKIYCSFQNVVTETKDNKLFKSSFLLQYSPI